MTMHDGVTARTVELSEEEVHMILTAIERVREQEGEYYWQHPNVRSVRTKLGQPSLVNT